MRPVPVLLRSFLAPAACGALLAAGTAGLAQTPAPADLFLCSAMAGDRYTLPPGACKVLQVQAGGGSGAADQRVLWSLEGPGALAPAEGLSTEYRAPRAGGGQAVVTAHLARDPEKRVRFTLVVPGNAAAPVPAAVDLLPYLPLVASERNQGSCADCYAWAVTAALEMELSVRYGIKDRLSVQYFHSIYRPLSPSDPRNACGPNPASLVVDLYREDGKLVPWSNPHAHFRAGGYPGVPAHFGPAIGLLPHYAIEQLTLHQIATHLWSDTEVIAELKERLHQRKAIIFKSGGHYMVIVGYNAEAADPAEHHWVVLDSRGTPAAMPGGTYRLPFSRVNYNHEDSPGHFVYTFEFLDLELRLQPEAAPAGAITANKSLLREGEALQLVASVGGRPPVRYQWLRDGQPLAGQTGSILRLPAVVPADAGIYTVQFSNSTGSATSEPLPVEVRPGAPRPAAAAPAHALDLNGDGVVDVLDLALLARAYEASEGDPRYAEVADLNRDGLVGADDAQEFLRLWDAQR